LIFYNTNSTYKVIYAMTTENDQPRGVEVDNNN
jgi:hypothetical protein